MGFNPSPEIISTIHRFGNKYNIKLTDRAITEFIQWFRMHKYLISMDELTNLKIALLVELFNEAWESGEEISVSATIKGIRKTVKIDNNIDIQNISHNINNYLIALSSGYYEYQFGWELKESLTHSYFPRVPYDKEQISKIIEQEKKLHIGVSNKIGKTSPLSMFCYLFREHGIFDNKVKTIRTAEACFLYDALTCLGLYPKNELLNNQEKYQFIKRYLNYETKKQA